MRSMWITMMMTMMVIDDEYMMMTVIPLVLQVVLASKDLAGRAKGIGRPAEPDFALVGGH